MTVNTKLTSASDVKPMEIIDYWNDYYARRQVGTRVRPSQFAAFFVGEVDPGATIIDIGCGNGRDSFFFAASGFRTISVDASQAAIDRCRSFSSEAGLNDATFVCSSVEDPALGQRLVDLVGSDAPIAMYARFLLHAITQEQEDRLLDMASKLCRPQDIFAVEFRTLRDIAQEKVTAHHFRRFIDPLHFIANAARRGFETRYFVEGFGFAKYKNDDAHVARCILGTTNG